MLAIRFAPSIQSQNESREVCTVCNRRKFSIPWIGRSHRTIRTLFFDEFVRHLATGRPCCNDRQQTIARGFASPPGAGAGGRPFGRHQCAIPPTVPLVQRSLPTARIAGRIERRQPERIRFVSRKGCLQQITMIGKEGCGTEGDTVPETRVESQAFNYGNRRSSCRRDC